MREFLEELFNNGELTVPGGQTQFEPAPVDDIVARFDAAARASIAGAAPSLDVAVAAWAAMLLASSVRLLVVRDAGTEEIDKAFVTRSPCPRAPGHPEVDYSADLFLSYLPGLAKFAKRLAADDPLLEKIRAIGTEWPLSSVGMEDIEASPGSVETFINHAGLRQLYVDRIFAAEETARVNHPLVAETVLASLGAHPELSPAIADAARKIAGNGAEWLNAARRQ